MSGYKPGNEINSPMYRKGQEDGIADNERVARELQPLGPLPPNPDYPVMYMRGYTKARG